MLDRGRSFGRPWTPGTAVLVFDAFATWLMKSKLEEEFLVVQFAADYAAYQRKVRALILLKSVLFRNPPADSWKLSPAYNGQRAGHCFGGRVFPPGLFRVSAPMCIVPCGLWRFATEVDQTLKGSGMLESRSELRAVATETHRAPSSDTCM